MNKIDNIESDVVNAIVWWSQSTHQYCNQKLDNFEYKYILV